MTQNTNSSWNNKTAVITGAGSGIGRELAKELARAGANVVCCGRREPKLLETVDIIDSESGTGLSIPTDVTEWRQVQRMVQETLNRFGQIDLLYNNAGSFRQIGPVWEADPEVWWKDVTVNLYGSALCTRAVLPHMMERDSGIIINVDGGGGSNAAPVYGSAYGCSKIALLRFSEGLARELEREGSSILVFCMNPGFVRTDMTNYLIATPERLKWLKVVDDLMDTEVECSANASAKAVMEVLRIACTEISGRIFYADTDFNEIEKRKHEIQKENLYVMHLIGLEGRLDGWPASKLDKYK